MELQSKNLFLFGAILLILLGGWYLWAPSGGNLIPLKDADLAQFTKQFDSAAGDERVLVLLSPT